MNRLPHGDCYFYLYSPRLVYTVMDSLAFHVKCSSVIYYAFSCRLFQFILVSILSVGDILDDRLEFCLVFSPVRIRNISLVRFMEICVLYDTLVYLN